MSIIDELKQIGFKADSFVIWDKEKNGPKEIISEDTFKINIESCFFDAPIFTRVIDEKIYASIDVWGEYEIDLSAIKSIPQIKKLIEALKGE